MGARAELALVLGKLPSELTPEHISFEEVLFLLKVHHKKEIENRKQLIEDLGYLLGVYWQLDDLDNKIAESPVKVKQDKVMLPLAVSIATSGMNPKAFSKTIDELKKKAYNHNKNIESAMDNANKLSKDEYINLFSKGLKKRTYR